MMRSILAASAVGFAAAAVPADSITSLPGFGAPVSALYSGYLSGGAGKTTHYVYSESQRAPSTDPLVLWFNGGPGCSSMEGAFSESGPYHIQEFTVPPTLALNNWTWNRVSNNLFFEAPAGVGFSYCDTPAGCHHSDTSTAQDNLASLLSFLAAYPERANNDIYITGESYAGIYVPSFAYAIIQYNALPSTTKQINLKGIMVGNGCIGYDAGHCGNDDLNDYHDVMTWRGHGLISETAYDEIISVCDWSNESNACNNALNNAANSIGDIDIYYLYNTCDDPALMRKRAPYGSKGMLARVEKARTARKAAAVASGVAPLGLDPNCFSTTGTLEDYMNDPATKAALHVSPDIDFAVCQNNGTWRYSPDIADERTVIYPAILAAKVRVLVYNGEADLCVPFTDNEWWTRTMNLTVVSPWSSWSVPGERGPYVGGYLIQYEQDFAYASVRGAGHMVPEVRPEAAYSLFTTFINA